MMLAALTGVVQAYIFAVLTVVYLSAAVRSQESR
jgi:F0F1-type ATP synthase membrane subunit a